MIKIKFRIIIKLNSKKNLEILISKQKESKKVIEAISKLLPFFRPKIKIDESYNNYYGLKGKNDVGKFALLYTIIEEIADFYFNIGSTPNFRT